MTRPKDLLAEVAGHAIMSGMTGRSMAGGALRYAHCGMEIPDHLLPGRFIMRMSASEREVLSRLTSDDAADVADWHAKIMAEMTTRWP